MFLLLNKKRGLRRSRILHNSLAPDPHAGHQPGHTWLWDDISYLNQGLLQVEPTYTCVLYVQYVRTDPTSVQLGWFWAVGRTLHSLYSHIPEVVCDNPGSVRVNIVVLEDGIRPQTVEICDHHWLQGLVLICWWYSVEMLFSEDQTLLLNRCNNQHSV